MISYFMLQVRWSVLANGTIELPGNGISQFYISNEKLRYKNTKLESKTVDEDTISESSDNSGI